MNPTQEMLEMIATEAVEATFEQLHQLPFGQTVKAPEPPNMHTVLIEQAAAWLQRKQCYAVITDMASGTSETPDAIGWHGSKCSMLIECKASRSDFLADRFKPFRRMPERGMGRFRYFAAPAGMLKPSELPADWGLLEWDGRKLRETVKATSQKACHLSEKRLLLSLLRRIGQTAPKGVSVKCYVMESKCRATFRVRKETAE